MEWILLFFGLVIVGVLYIYKENETEQKIRDLKNDFELRINVLTESNNKLNETIESNKHQINLLTNTNLTLTKDYIKSNRRAIRWRNRWIKYSNRRHKKQKCYRIRKI